MTGAGRRLGRAIALALGRAGCDVAVHYRSSRAAAEATVAELRALGRDAEALGADLTKPADIDALFADLASRFGGLDILVNSAASFERAALADIGWEDWDRVLAINARAPLLCLQRSLPLFAARARRPGRQDGARAPAAVINLGDLSGQTPWRGYAHHGASKAALLHLTRCAARELAPEVRVNALVPGPILPPPGEEEGDPAWEARGQRLPLGRTGRPEEVADAVLFLARCEFVTGVALLVDGGEHLLSGGRP